MDGLRGYARTADASRRQRGSPLLKGEVQGEVWDVSEQVTHLTPALSFQEREHRRGCTRRIAPLEGDPAV
jgi:hypothetical protein